MNRRSVIFFLFLIALFIYQGGASAANPGIIPVTQFNTSTLPGGIPEGWSLENKTGRPLLNMEKAEGVYYLRLISPGDSSFGLRKEARIDVKKFPILSWRWKVAKLPRGGDVRKSSTDDQALQVYVAFKKSGILGINTPVVGYIWDNEAPKGWSGRSPQIGGDKLRYIVLRNKTDNVGQWYTERRNVYRDYKRLFADIDNGEPQSLTTGLQIHINSQRTKTPAESMIGDIYFSSEPSDIILVEAGKEAPREKEVKIAAVKPPIIAKKPAEKIPVIPSCFSLNVEFDTDSILLSDDYKAAIQTVAEYLIKHNEAQLNIVGHTDDIGSAQYNLELSRQRAESVQNYLVNQLGVDPQRLHVRGAGIAQPIAGNDTPEGRQRNRRALVSNCPESSLEEKNDRTAANE